MVANSIRTIGIIVACVIALILIGIAFLISGPLPSLFSTANAASTHDLLVQYASKDSDNDGLPDWEEALYGTDPNNPHSISPTLTDGQAVAQGLATPKFANATSTPVDANSIPGPTVANNTVTDQFSKQLFGQYFQNRGAAQPTPDQIASFVEQGVQQLEASQAHQDAFNAGQVKVSGTGASALKAYAAQVEQVFAANGITTDQSELLYFSQAVNRSDDAALGKVGSIADAYGRVARALIALPVPNEAASAHLEMANALMRMHDVTSDMAAIKTDPLRSMLGLGEYQTDATALAKSFDDAYTVYSSENITMSAGEPGYYFYHAMTTLHGTLNPTQ